MINKPLILLIKLYSYFISPLLSRQCKFYPSCSQYATKALRQYFIVHALYLILWRILRCNPFSRGGYDPVGKKI